MSRAKIISIVLFAFGLYLTLLSPFSGGAVAAINGGYGTFDLKKYDADVFLNVMKATSNVSLYWKYYVCDFIFTAVFLNYMIQMVRGFNGTFINKVKVAAYIFAVIRGLLDTSENIILLNQIYSYPKVNLMLIDLCNVITRIKFHFMRGWIACFVFIIIANIISKRRNHKNFKDENGKPIWKDTYVYAVTKDDCENLCKS